MAFDFPNSPFLAQVVVGPNGLQYIWDGTKWIPGTTPNNLAPINAPTFTGDPKAPTPTAGDNDTSIATTAFVQNAISGIAPTILANTGRNYALNSQFRVRQRSGPFTTTSYTADQWKLNLTLDACTVTVPSAADADKTAIGDEDVNWILNAAVTGNAGATAATAISQPIETVTRLANKNVCISFWAKASAGTPKIGVSYQQQFGSGGSPSAAVLGTGTAVTLSTTWARYSATFAVPSIVGKTMGTAGDNFTNIVLWLSSGANNNTYAGGIGVQTATFQIYGIQVEVGTTPSAFEKVPYADDAARCQRYFVIGSFYTAGYSVTGVGVGSMLAFPVTMRGQPVIATSGVTQTNCTGNSSNVTSSGFMPYATASANGGIIYFGNYTASAEL